MGYVGLGYIATGSGHLSQQYSSTSSVLRYDIDTTAGESGAPIYTISKFTVGTTESYVFNVIGIHSGTSNDGNPYNRGVRMRPEILKFFKNNSHITY